MFSTLGDVIMNVGDTMSTSGYVKYIRGIPGVHWGDIMSTSGVFSTSEGYHDTSGGAT